MGKRRRKIVSSVTLHNGVEFKSKCISLNFADKIERHIKSQKKKGWQLVSREELSGFAYMRFVEEKNVAQYNSKPQPKVQISELDLNF